MKQKTISFDVDGTLIRWDWNNELQSAQIGKVPNPKFIKLLKKFHKQGHKVIIVTSRGMWDEENLYKAYMFDGGDDHRFISVKAFVEIHDIPVKSEDIYFTEGRLKASTLLNLKVDTHYDDDLDELIACNECGINAIRVTDEENGFSEVKHKKGDL